MEITRSSAYHIARYTVLPKVIGRAKDLKLDQFLLREVASPILEEEVPAGYRDVIVPYAHREGGVKFIQTIKWFLSLNAKSSDELEDQTMGYFKLRFPPAAISESEPTESDLETQLGVAIESALDEGDEEAGEFDGWIYAFSFPRIVIPAGAFPIKVGKTTQDVEARVMAQAKEAACFEKPVILASWQVKRVGPTELAIHNTLKAWNLWMEDAPGQEWFNTTVSKIQSIIQFISQPI